jgi:ketosteroid isomerase-like protein
MSKRGALLVGLGIAAAAAACGQPDQRVVDQYFNALRQGDTQTLTSFALVQLDQKVDSWKITGSTPETTAPAPLADLIKKVAQIEADLAANKKTTQNFANEDNGKRYQQIQDVQEAQKKNAKVPAALADVAQKWADFNDKDRALKKQLADAKTAVEHEKRNVTLSVGNQNDVESMTGQMVSRDLDLALTIAGDVKPYAMTLRRYDLQGGTNGRVVSRWFIYSLKPKA